jgi:hypothetical protein
VLLTPHHHTLQTEESRTELDLAAKSVSGAASWVRGRLDDVSAQFAAVALTHAAPAELATVEQVSKHVTAYVTAYVTVCVHTSQCCDELSLCQCLVYTLVCTATTTRRLYFV